MTGPNAKAGALLSRRRVLAASAAALAAGALPRDAWGRTKARAAVHDIRMLSDATGARVWFDPVGLLLPVGAAVRWLAVEGVHTATAYHPGNGGKPLRIPRAARPWHSGILQAGEAFTVTLRVPGVYDFFCEPHEAAGMVGRLVVGNGDDGEPNFDPTRVPEAARGVFPSVAQIRRERRVGATDPASPAADAAPPGGG